MNSLIFERFVSSFSTLTYFHTLSSKQLSSILRSSSPSTPNSRPYFSPNCTSSFHASSLIKFTIESSNESLHGNPGRSIAVIAPAILARAPLLASNVSSFVQCSRTSGTKVSQLSNSLSSSPCSPASCAHLASPLSYIASHISSVAYSRSPSLVRFSTVSDHTCSQNPAFSSILCIVSHILLSSSLVATMWSSIPSSAPLSLVHSTMLFSCN